MSQPVKTQVSVNYSKIQAFFSDPSNPLKQIDLLDELINIKVKAADRAKANKISFLSTEDNLRFIEGSLMDQSTLEPKVETTGEIDDKAKGEAKKYIYALGQLLENIMDHPSNFSSAHMDYVLILSVAINVLFSGGGEPNSTPIKIDPMIKNFLLHKINNLVITDLKEMHDKVVSSHGNISQYQYNTLLDVVKKDLLNNASIDKNAKTQLNLLIDEIQGLQTDDPKLINNCAKALIAIGESINDPNRPKERLIQDLSEIFFTFFSDIKYSGVLGQLEVEVDRLNRDQPEKTINCAVLLIQSLRIITKPELTKDKEYLEKYNNTAAATNSSSLLKIIKDLINTVLSSLKITDQPTFFKDRASLRKSQEALLKQFEPEQESKSDTTPKPR